MKVAAFLYAYPPDRLAGADLMARDLLQALHADGADVHVFTTSPVSPGPRDGIHVQRRTRFRLGDGWDLVYSHPDLGAEAFQVARRQRIPYLAVVHNTSPRTGRWLAKYPPTLTVWNGIATRAAHGGEGGIICRSPLRVADHEVRSTGDAVTLINLCPAKGGTVFWDLAARLPGIPFLGVRGGWGPQLDRPPGRPLPNVTIVGPLPHPLSSVWARTGLLLMPSEAESWGRVGLEAACSGIPTVAHPTLGLLEALGDAGTFVDRRDVAAWEQAVQGVDRDVMGQRARRRAAQVEAMSRDDLADFVSAVHRLGVRPLV